MVESAKQLRKYPPTGEWSIDPRNSDTVLFNPARAERPVSYGKVTADDQDCPICQGNTTGILDYQALSEGWTFINMNLFPMLLPDAAKGDTSRSGGLHFVQWTSSFHEVDWPELSPEDRFTVMQRLAAIESALYAAAPLLYSGSGTKAPAACVSMIKNAGRSVGGSMEHGHQQIALTNHIPGSLAMDRSFAMREGMSFASWLLRSTVKDLTVKDYGSARLVVPPFMKRPHDMILVLTEPSGGCLFHADADELKTLAEGWADGIFLMKEVLKSRGREPSYNIVAHTDPAGSSLYFEFLPYTQEYGGYERSGLYSCQGEPSLSAALLREILSNR